MSGTNAETTTLKHHFLGLFEEDCQQKCLVAKMAAAQAARETVEMAISFEKASETLAHRFGRCVLGPKIAGNCGQLSICRNELVGGIEDPYEARDILTSL